MSIDGEYSGTIFDTDLSAVAATYIHRRLPGLGSHVDVTANSNLNWSLLSITNVLAAVIDKRKSDMVTAPS